MLEVGLGTEEVSEHEWSWLRQKKFLKVMDGNARRILQTLSRMRQPVVNSEHDHGEHWGVALSLAAVASGETDWSTAREMVREKEKIEEPETTQIGRCLPPLALIQRLPNTAAGHVAREFGITGPCWTSGGGLVMEALLQGIRWVAEGECQNVMAAGVQTDGVVAVFLGYEPAGEGSREVSAWSLSPLDEDQSGTASGSLEAKAAEDWKQWRSVSGLWTRTGNLRMGMRMNLP